MQADLWRKHDSAFYLLTVIHDALVGHHHVLAGVTEVCDAGLDVAHRA